MVIRGRSSCIFNIVEDESNVVSIPMVEYLYTTAPDTNPSDGDSREFSQKQRCWKERKSVP
jgi:hypothetical protein